MLPAYKSVPAVEKCFAILDLLSKNNKPLGISDISRQLGFNKSTVFNLVYTLIDLNVLAVINDGKFGFGTRLYTIGNTAGNRSHLIQTVHPYLETINRETKLSAFLGIRSELKAVLIDKVDSAYDIKISSEIGMQMPQLAGAGIKAMLSLLSESDMEALIEKAKFKKFTPNSIVSKEAYIDEINKVRREGIAFDREEYIEGMVAVAVPIKTNGRHIQVAIWAVGLKQQVPTESMPDLTNLIKDISGEINQRLL
jgi:DNA-binding IclR family transcriptional regulator